MSVTAMYKAGHDSLGEEMMTILTDKENVSRKLLRIAMLRLGKHLELIEKKIHLTHQVETTLKSFGSKFGDVAIEDFNLTANLWVALSSNDLGNSGANINL